MLRIVGYGLMAVGMTWIYEALLGFRIDAARHLYPLDAATRQVSGVVFLASGILIEWMKSRKSKREILQR